MCFFLFFICTPQYLNLYRNKKKKYSNRHVCRRGGTHVTACRRRFRVVCVRVCVCVKILTPPTDVLIYSQRPSSVLIFAPEVRGPGACCVRAYLPVDLRPVKRRAAAA